MRLGCIADDYTGASDVATALSRSGLRTTLLFGPPAPETEAGAAEVVVVGLKIRTAPAGDAVEAALAARRWLMERGAERIYFKYCSTFDSTEAGNIGPIADALLEAAGAGLTVVCPAAPEHGRTVYQGHLFVGSRLLSDTPMRDHPLTPMRDSSVVRLMNSQTEGAVGLLAHDRVSVGPKAVREGLERLRAEGVRYAVADAIGEDDLRNLGQGTRGLELVTGAAGLARHVLAPGQGHAEAVEQALPAPAAVLAGSCSAATLEQVERARERLRAYRLDPRAAAGSDALVADCLDWVDGQPDGEPLLVYSSAPPDERAAGAADAVEQAMAALARELVDRGVRRLIVAGGETSAAVLDSIGVIACTLGAEEALGVPWLFAGELALLLKSGNFGDPDLLVRAAERPS
jgi:3-dehydrotetronate 4-kinase